MKKIPNRKIDTDTYMTAVKGMLKEGAEVPLTITGGSMTPFLIHERDRVLIRSVDRPLKMGDMAFYQRRTGQYVMHRIQRIRRGANGDEQYYLIGDAQNVIEGPIDQTQIFGLITAVCRKGKWMKPGDFWWEFFRRIWLHLIPFRRLLMRIYGLFK